MSHDLGPGVSRVLDGTDSGYNEVILQQGKPPLDSEFNLLQELASDFSRRVVLRGSPSGFLGNETNSHSDFLTSADWSNWFQFGSQRASEQRAVVWANVNGWLIPVTGTQTGTPPGAPNDTDTFNRITLEPPPASSGDRRVDYVFLEVWQARVSPNPASTNKPSSSAIYKYGNVEGGASFLADDIVDPALGFETTQRVQLQYRIRVVTNVLGLTTNPDGFDPAVVKAQGAAADPTSWVFENMRSELGDPGLWRAGDGTQGALGTVDGYSYAIPIAGIFRRNSVAWVGDPSQNINGAFNRNPAAVDRTGAQTFTTVATLGADLAAGETTSVDLVSSDGIPLPITPASPVFIQIGDEILTYGSVTTGSPPQLVSLTRGLNGTRDEFHAEGTEVLVLSGRPDGLFSDQITGTDILDLRHLVNPNGFDYESLLKSNFDRLLRGQLRANWKRSGGTSSQGPFVSYQDKISTGAVSLGVTQLDAPDNIRLAFSDAAQIQRVDSVVAPLGAIAPPTASGSVAWSLGLSANVTQQAAPNLFAVGTILEFPVSQLLIGLPGGDIDQVRWVNDGVADAITIRVDGQTAPVDPSLYSVTPANPTPTDDLTIEFLAGFPTIDGTNDEQIYVTLSVMYGPGRGLSRRPDSLHSVSYINPGSDLLISSIGTPSNNLKTHTSWELLWSKYRNTTYKGLLPSTSEVYADLGSKSVVLTPFRRVAWPANFRAMDGTAANIGAEVESETTGSVAGGVVFTDVGGVDFTVNVTAGMALVIPSGPAAGRYTILSVGGPTSLTVQSPGFLVTTAGITYTINSAQGLMPLNEADGVTPKWTTTDPLDLFSGTTTPSVDHKDMYVTLPRHMVPGWGEVHVPILASGSGTFAEGVNYMLRSQEGAIGGITEGDKNYVPYADVSGGSTSYQTFSTVDLPAYPTPASYNTLLAPFGGVNYAGMRKFTDTRGLGREGLELPPFYGIARMFAVYEAQDFAANTSSYDTDTRAFDGGGATNLLRQDMGDDGPAFWIELDEDGDSTFILNAKALDLSKSPTPIASFAAGEYVIEASIFGFDRGAFDLDKEFRLLFTRPGTPSRAWDPTGNRDAILTANDQAGPTTVLPGPAGVSDQVVINYSRTPYQGDAWGSQNSYSDLTYKPGPLQTTDAYQLDSTELDESALTRPNQKMLEVVASLGFATSLGTGRMSGDVLLNEPLDFRDVGYEDPTAYPPTTAIQDRPRTLPNRFQNVGDGFEVGTEYLGSTERLPLGALYRDKDFRGHTMLDEPLIFVQHLYDAAATVLAGSLAVDKSLDQSEVRLDTASTSIGAPGDLLVHVDGEDVNNLLLVNFRTNRGGSVFVAGGGHPGGELIVSHPIQAQFGNTRAVAGRAFLVRNAPTDVGANEVSAGSELMMLVVTQVLDGELEDSSNYVAIINGTNGSGEGKSAADLYRIEGHPLVRDNVKVTVDPATITLSKRAF